MPDKRKVGSSNLPRSRSNSNTYLAKLVDAVDSKSILEKGVSSNLIIGKHY